MQSTVVSAIEQNTNIVLDVSVPPISVAALTVTNNSVKLIWASENKDIGFSSFGIYRNGIFIEATSGFMYIDNNLSPGTEYTYCIEARSENGKKIAASNKLIVTTQSKVESVLNPPQRVIVLNITETTVELEWDKVQTTGACLEYMVYNGESCANVTTSTSCIVKDLIPATKYLFSIIVRDSSGNMSAPSNSINVTTLEKTRGILKLPNSDFQTNRFIVKYKNNKEKEKFVNAFKDRKFIYRKVKQNKMLIDTVIIDRDYKLKDFIDEIKSKQLDHNIDYVQPDYEVNISSNDIYFSKQWGLENKSIMDSSNKVHNGLILKKLPQKLRNIISSNPELEELLYNNSPEELRHKLLSKEIPAYASSELLMELFHNPLLNDISLSTSSNSPSYLCDANVASAWNISTGSGITVGVIDTGIDISHEDIASNIWTNSSEIPSDGIDNDGNGYIDDINGWNFANNSNQVFGNSDPIAENHGTHIAGIISAVKDNEKGISGVAPGAKVLPLKVFTNGKAFTSDIISAIEYAENLGIKIVNCSWGCSEYNPALYETLNDSKMLFVCAAGNDGVDIDINPVYPASFDCPNIISVTSLNRYGTLSLFSNIGEASIDVAAPGEEIQSTLPGNKYGENSGTSMATAFVSGEAAILMSHNTTAGLLEIKSSILDYSDRLSSLTGKVKGSSKINFINSLNTIQNNEIIKISEENSEQNTSMGQEISTEEITNDYNLFSLIKAGGQFTKISAGYSHSLALHKDGTVWAWGDNGYGRLGDGTTIQRKTPVHIINLNNVISIAAGCEHSLALKNDGTVWAWGYNGYGQLGDGTTITTSAPIQVNSLADVIQIAAGYEHSLALKSDGTVWAWGYNGSGQLGNGSSTSSSIPVKVHGLNGIVAISGGYQHGMALKNDGTVWTWGYNAYGQLGDGTVSNRVEAVQVAGLSGVTKIAAGYFHSLALSSNGMIKSWGDNAYGQLGDGTTTSQSGPVQIYGLLGIADIDAGFYHSLALSEDGSIQAWGTNNSGQLGDGTVNLNPIPKKINGINGVISLASGYYHNLMLKNDGTIWAWGGDYSGQIGLDAEQNKKTPFLVNSLYGATDIAGGGMHSLSIRDGTVWTSGLNDSGQLGDSTLTSRGTPIQVGNFGNVISIVAGLELYSVALCANGTVLTWGYNDYGQLGNGSYSYDYHRLLPARVEGIDNIVQISGGVGHCLALKNDGTVWAWGLNECGQLGDGTFVNRYTPIQIIGLSGIIAVSGMYEHCLALKNDGTVWAWGLNCDGQVGDGTNIDRTIPVQVSGLYGIVAIEGGGSHNLALKSDGTVWAWGANSEGQLGDGTTISKTTPVQVDGLKDIKAISAGYDHNLAIRKDGTVWAWGNNNSGQLGDGTVLSRHYPVQVQGLNLAYSISAGYSRSLVVKDDGTVWTLGQNSTQVNGLSNIIAISAGQDHSFALKSDGTAWGWGWNWSGQLGDGTLESRNLPVKVRGSSIVSSITAVAGGERHSLALKSNGTVWAWGNNEWGQLGDCTTTNSSIPVQVMYLDGVISIARGGYHSLALKNDGTVRAWGYNDFGQLGDRTTESATSPVIVIGLDDVISVSGGEGHSIALKNDGTVWTWGYNGFGQLGDNTNISKQIPTKVNFPLTYTGTIIAISAGYEYSLALGDDGTIWAWGDSYGYTPKKVSEINDFIAISAGYDNNLALRRDGSVYAWGNNHSGQLGDGTVISSLSPVQVTGLTGIVKITAGYDFGMALKNDGTVWAWGSNYYGELGNGENRFYEYPQWVIGTPVKPSVTKSCIVDFNKSSKFNLILKTNNMFILGRKITITYDNSSILDVKDLCAMTYNKDLGVGPVADTDIRILQNEPGVIKFTSDKPVEEGKTWSGVVNIITFEPAASGTVTLTCTIEY
jgi:alpha-tubulin suppressor-like RCC1 family protein/subtilisin family serine protease/chitodextrinase